MVIDAQEKDGSWPAASGHIGAAQADAKIYHTCLCTLMLEGLSSEYETLRETLVVFCKNV